MININNNKFFVIQKIKTIWSIFSIIIFSYFEIEVSEFAKNESEETKNLAIASVGSEISQKPRSRLRNKRTNTIKQDENVRKWFKNCSNFFCKNYDNNHMMKNWFLILNKNKFWIIKKSRKIFENNIKNSAFHKHVKSVCHYKQ